jgi:hypothetical protein
LLKNWFRRVTGIHGWIVFKLASGKVSATCKPAKFPGLPSQSKFVHDKRAILRNEINRLCNKKYYGNFTILVITNKSGNLVSHTRGYKIDIGEQVAKAIAP